MMKNDGGPAFPNHEVSLGSMGLSREAGMSLRDYFAAAALQGFAAHNGLNICGPNNGAYNVARMAFEVANAMIAERDK